MDKAVVLMGGWEMVLYVKIHHQNGVWTVQKSLTNTVSCIIKVIVSRSNYNQSVIDLCNAVDRNKWCEIWINMIQGFSHHLFPLAHRF